MDKQAFSNYVGRYVAFLVAPLLPPVLIWLKDKVGLDISNAEATAWIVAAGSAVGIWIWNRGRLQKIFHR